MVEFRTRKQGAARRQTGVKLDMGLLRELKVVAAKKDSTLGELPEEAMEDYLEKVRERESK
jgi:hypothetical protein